jgi:hypothetical protein
VTKKSITKTRKKKSSAKKIQKGSIGNFFVYGVLALLIVLGITAVGGLPERLSPNSGENVLAVTPTKSANYSNLQLKWFGYITLTPSPTPVVTHSCQRSQGVLLNTETEILQGSDPGPGGGVNNDIIRVWAKDENPPWISPNEKVDSTTGLVSPGDRLAVDTPTDGKGNFFWEPSLYIVPLSQPLNANHVYCDTHTPGCSAIYPIFIKGDYNTADRFKGGSFAGDYKGPPVDSDANYLNGPDPNGGNPNGNRDDKYLGEYIWNISSLNLASGSYIAQFVVHDGDTNLAVDCFTITF